MEIEILSNVQRDTTRFSTIKKNIYSIRGKTSNLYLDYVITLSNKICVGQLNC